MVAYILPIGHDEATLAVVGAKGESLNRMYRAAFPVPPGYFVTTAAYNAFLQANDLQEAVEFVDSRAGTSGTRSVAIRRLFAGEAMPTEIAEAIIEGYAALALTAPDAALAVRSSATVEDLPGASFAGQLSTYLNVSGNSALLAAVQRCWASLWTPRALDYRTRHQIPSSTVAVGVVVQAMVPAETSGVMFTANPISGSRDEVAIDAAWGLGKAVVDGLVTQTTWLWTRRHIP